MEKLLMQLTEEASKVQDVPPSRQGDRGHGGGADGGAAGGRGASGAGQETSSVGQEGRGAVSDSSSSIL
jgi:hypothetical protein